MKEYLETLLKEYTTKKELNRIEWQKSESMQYTDYLIKDSYFEGCIETITTILAKLNRGEL